LTSERPDDKRETNGSGARPPGWSPLLEEILEEVRSERRRLETHANWRAIAEAEREIAPGLAAEVGQRLRQAVTEREQRAVTPAEEGEHQRFGLLFRVQHVGLFISTLALIVTGLPLRYAETAWARAFFTWIGGVAVQAALHRWAAALLIAVGAFHMGYATLTSQGRRELLALLPRPKDVVDLFRNLARFVGLTRHGPRFDRFSYVEKFDYWAVYWGIVIMVGSGLLLWSPGIAMRYLPKYALDIATIIHSDEALLAATAIIIWHFYNAHLNPDVFPMNWAWFTGRISMEDMRKHHPLEYERLYGGPEKSEAGEKLSK
jgi:cytochrome b subunit of formate dehydrogenase